MNSKKRKQGAWIKWVVVIVVIAVVVVLVWPRISTLIGGTSTTGTMGATASTGTTTTGLTQGEYVAVEKGNLEVTVYGSGSLSPRETYSVYNDSEGKIESIEVETGDTVQAGDVLVRLSSSDIETNISTYEAALFDAQVALSEVRDTGTDYYVYSPSAGTLKVLMCEEADDVASVMNQYGYLAVISRDDKMRVEFEPVADYGLEIGDVVNVWIDNLAIMATVDQTVGLGANIAVTLPDDDYDVGEEVLVTTLQGQTIGYGLLEINMPVPITAIGGVVETIYYEEGESVSSGAKLFYTTGRLPSSDLQSALLKYEEARTALDNEKEKQDNLIIRAPIDGIVTSVGVSVGARLDESVSLVTLQSQNSFNVIATVDELDIVNVEIGQQVDIEIDAYPDEVFTGTVRRISGVGNVSGGVATYEVTVAVDDTTGRLKDGMTASIEIVIANKEDAILIPVEAISTSNGQKYVTLSTGLSTTITTGLSNDEYVEALSGVSEGDQVLVTRSTSTSTTTTMPSGMGGMAGGMGGGMPSGGGMGGGMPGM
ncbi:MAG: efflux RND transporter periplasmic adaptor subunit [Clostridia bacterium]|nr:efflux RND transporter periplasmic adaptor subunit [Clostridia bacterium]